MYFLFSYQNTNSKDHTSTHELTLFVGDTLYRSSYNSVKSFFDKPNTYLQLPFTDYSTFDSQCYSMVCRLSDLGISTIRTAIANHFPEYLL